MPGNDNGVNIRQDRRVPTHQTPAHQTPPHPAPRSTYHHGDLTNALTDAATNLARTGGPSAVVLREAARRVGVSATAAYRHFAGHGELMHAVKHQAQAALARAMREELDAEPADQDPGRDAVRRLRALGATYVRFALAEPGLFRTAFCHLEAKTPTVAADPGPESASAYQMLSEVLDDMVDAGLLSAQQRGYAPVAAWSAVHGLALLVLDGPLAQLPAEQLGPLIQGTVEVTVAGLTATAARYPG
jgi:AcrR family transcriptional regulator